MDHCKVAEPPMQEVQPGHFVACHLRQPGQALAAAAASNPALTAPAH
jgi:hypothetical protein